MRALLFAVLALLPLPALAQQGSDTTDDVMRLSRHIAEMRELLTSRDADVRDAAIERALTDPSPTIRGLAISYALRRYNNLPLHFALPEGSPTPPEDLPSVTLDEIRWSDDGRSFNALVKSCGNYPASAEVMADRLRLQISSLCFGAGLLGPSSEGHGPAKLLHFSGCEAELVSNKARDAMEGKLRCPNLPMELPLALPLG